MFNHIRMVVLATNAVGSPDLFLTSVEATDTQYQHGRHYDMAFLRARDQGCSTPMMVFDQHDAAARMLRRAPRVHRRRHRRRVTRADRRLAVCPLQADPGPPCPVTSDNDA
ncbi:hypothetical protein [Paraburkholderia strydomiana]|uniref:hypothetical protein n=1 Tax=Paraburkholderia strydomiana TaxID=1245417 RepID=UPI0038BC6094